MGRELKRVPLDFNYPLKTVWYGYYDTHISFCHSNYSAGCEGCRAYAKIKGIEIEDDGIGCPDFEKFYGIDMKTKVEPPVGDGYQLWETTSEGSPISPVFKTLDDLCEWCETNATVIADLKTSKENWKNMLEDGLVYHQMGNAIFI